MKKNYVKQLVLAVLLLMGFTAAGQESWNIGVAKSTDVIATLENGVLTISGEGDMKNWSSYSDEYRAPWYENRSSITKAVIEEGVEHIGDCTFEGCSALTKITIPNSVITIGGYAFSGTGLTELTIPNNVKTVNFGAFSYCEDLTQIVIGSGFAGYGRAPFAGCTALKNIIVSEQNANFASENDVLFNKDKTELLIYPKAKEGAYTIPNTVKEISYQAFEGCSALTEVTIPNSVTHIAGEAFNNCTGLTEITIPSSVTHIGSLSLYSVFQGCDNLKTLYFNAVKCENFDVAYGKPFPASLQTVIIGNEVTHIPDYAFYKCTSLANVTIGTSVATIGEDAFYGCRGLNSFTVSEQNANYASEDGLLFNKNKTELIRYPSAKQGTAYTIPNTVTKISHWAFEGCSALTEVTIPNNVTHIGDGAFSGCTSLTQVIIPSSVTSIDWLVFSDCVGLAEIIMPSTVTEIEWLAFDYCTGLTSFTILNTNPVVITNSEGVLNNGISNCKLIVPAESIEAYKTAWAKYIGEDKAFTSVEAYVGNIYSIELKTTTGGIVNGSGSEAEGTTCTATAVANEGYTFVNWLEGGEVVSRNAKYAFAVNKNRTLQAVFVENESSNVDVSNVEIPADKGVAITVETDNAVVAWTSKDNAASYSLVIKDSAGENVICLLEFDGDGRLVGLTFGATLRSTSTVYGFKVTNLEENTTYKYILKTLDAAENVIDTKQGEFTTKSGEQTAISSIETAPATVVAYYNIMGQRLAQEPAHGVYIILYNNGTSQKVVKK